MTYKQRTLFLLTFHCVPTMATKISEMNILVQAYLIVNILVTLSGAFHLRKTDDLAKGAVVTNTHGCAEIGRDVLKKGGSAVDAAIAALLCEGVTLPSAMGIGGGFTMTIYSAEDGKVHSLNSREVAPNKAYKKMYGDDPKLASAGILAVAVPAELKGYLEAHKKFGKLHVSDLIKPTIDLCRTGILVSKFFAHVMEIEKDFIYNYTGLRKTFTNQETKELLKEGEHMKRLSLADTLEIMTKEGFNALHNGSLTQLFAEEMQSLGGIITVEDMNNYKAEWQEPLEISLPHEQTLYTAPPPASGAILTFIINLLNNFLDTTEPHSLKNWQRIVESFKFGYGRRTELGDANFEPSVKELVKKLTSMEYANEIRKLIHDHSTSQNASYYGAHSSNKPDHGTSHLSVLAPNGDAVSVTSTINLNFGSGILLPKTGILLNNQMDDFSSPQFKSSYGIDPSPINLIKPGKRPLSSTCPSIILDKNKKVRLVVGGAGGTKITTEVALVIINHLWYGMNIKDAVKNKRMHHQLFPMEIQIENAFKKNMEIVNGLAKIGHKYSFYEPYGFQAVTSISSITHEGVYGSFDPRRNGSVAYIY